MLDHILNAAQPLNAHTAERANTFPYNGLDIHRLLGNAELASARLASRRTPLARLNNTITKLN